MSLQYQPLGDSGVRIGFTEVIDPEVSGAIRALKLAIEGAEIPGILAMVPTYTALSVYYDPAIILYREMVERLQALEMAMATVTLPPARLVEIPVLYGGENGPDLAYVAKYHNLSEEEVVRLHTAQPYLVYMIGFTPGFPYLGGLPEILATPRLERPRTKIRGGSVGIGGSQTGIYSIDAPGGWQIIGHTPVQLYDAKKEEAVLLQAGDYLQFRAVNMAEYEEILAQVECGEYTPRISAGEEEGR